MIEYGRAFKESQATSCYLEYFRPIVLGLLSRPHDLDLPAFLDNTVQFFLLKLKGTWVSFSPHVVCVSDLIRLSWKLEPFCSRVTLKKAATCQGKVTDKSFSPSVLQNFSVRPGVIMMKKKKCVLPCPRETWILSKQKFHLMVQLFYGQMSRHFLHNSVSLQHLVQYLVYIVYI